MPGAAPTYITFCPTRPGTDARLYPACRRLALARKRCCRNNLDDAAITRAVDAYWRAADDLSAIQARTLAGIRAKARCYRDTAELMGPECPGTADLLNSLLNDLGVPPIRGM